MWTWLSWRSKLSRSWATRLLWSCFRICFLFYLETLVTLNIILTFGLSTAIALSFYISCFVLLLYFESSILSIGFAVVNFSYLYLPSSASFTRTFALTRCLKRRGPFSFDQGRTILWLFRFRLLLTNLLRSYGVAEVNLYFFAISKLSYNISSWPIIDFGDGHIMISMGISNSVFVV